MLYDSTDAHSGHPCSFGKLSLFWKLRKREEIITFFIDSPIEPRIFCNRDSYQSLVTPESADNLLAIGSSYQSSLTSCSTNNWSRDEEVLSEIKYAPLSELIDDNSIYQQRSCDCTRRKMDLRG